ncbi:hypothetical protein SKTS_34380 [Sulfurimicrobium lacus]|uniref:Uncharacterized protein n=1 Tax=Sulfurimicrobium lacus TaxID=2715678 RepID=A0A6F8VHY4_9PROT|nr:hypothetical protein SKTS_34380 [Sulfurimicrobium lacus]
MRDGKRCAIPGLDRIHPRQWRRIRSQPGKQVADGVFFAQGGNFHALAVIAHPALKSELARQAVNERPEADALNLAPYPDAN